MNENPRERQRGREIGRESKTLHHKMDRMIVHKFISLSMCTCVYALYTFNRKLLCEKSWIGKYKFKLRKIRSFSLYRLQAKRNTVYGVSMYVCCHAYIFVCYVLCVCILLIAHSVQPQMTELNAINASHCYVSVSFFFPFEKVD